MTTQVRRTRADTERTTRIILEAAERVLSDDPAATIEQIAADAGVARTTVHRRFATRSALLDALVAWATEQLHAAVEDARTESAPPLVALYQATINIVRVKVSWRFAMRQATTDPTVASMHTHLVDKRDKLFSRAQNAGVIRPDIDLRWAQRVYHALVDEVCRGNSADSSKDMDPDTLATAIVETLLHGIGTDTAHL